MPFSQEKNNVTGNIELVISGLEGGISDSPFEGIADIRNYNIVTLPHQASIEFATAPVILPPSGYVGVAFSADAPTDVFTVASTAGFYVGMALSIATSTGGGVIAGQTYYVGNITPTTFKLYTDIEVSLLLDVTVNATGTFTVQTFGLPSDSTFSPGTLDFDSGMPYKDVFLLTTDGLAWRLVSLTITRAGGVVVINTIQFLGNLAHSTASFPARGIVVFQGYLFVFMDSKIDYILVNDLTNSVSANWHYAWKTTTQTLEGHRAISATDDTLYFCNNTSVGSVLVNAGFAGLFNPTNAASYTYNTVALQLPAYDKAICLAQLGINLLVGGILTYVYPWDRVSTSFSYPLIVAESFIKCIVSTNSSAYIFAGNRGRIYITNGSNIDMYKKFPDAISGTVQPYYTWGWAIYWKNRIFFSISATTNSGTVISNYAGMWSYELSRPSSTVGYEGGVLTLSNSLSYGTYEGTVPVLVPMGNIFPTGQGVYAGYIHNGVGGVDFTSGLPYVNFEARIDTDIIPVGTFLNPDTFSNIEFKLAKPLVAGEAIRISQRSNLNDAYALIGSTNTVGLISDVYPMNFQNVQWLQLRIESSSSVTTPSYCPLLEIRLRR